jgi:hypothetical protein
MAITIVLGNSTSNAAALGDEYIDNPPVYEGWAYLNKGFAFSFTPYTSFMLQTASIRLRRWGGSGSPPNVSVAGTVVLTICEDSSGPFGSEVATASIDRLDLTSSWSNVQFAFLTTPTLLSSKYWIKIEDVNSVFNYGTDEYDATQISGATTSGSIPYWTHEGEVNPTDGWEVFNGYPKDIFGSLYGEESPSKPTTPSPANGAGPGINFTNRTVSWVDGGGAETYTIRMDSGGTPYNVVSLSQTGTSYTIPEADISRYQDNIISWRVDAEAGGETVTGDVWTFDPRPAKATTPSPTDGASNTALNLTTLSWVKDAYTDKSEVNCDWSGSVSPFSTSSNSIALANYTPLYMDRLGYSNTYTWSVDTTNEWGTTDGDDWTFDTISYSGASCSWKNYDGKTLGPFDGGLEGVDYYWLGTNCISTVKRVVAFAADRVWITEV